jgi:two-component system, NtrC family, response regulator PilR
VEKKGFTILVADDDETVRDVIATLLSREGYVVTAVSDGLEAISRLRTGEFHLVITDLNMPGADGLEVLRYAVRSCPDIAVVILTANLTLDTTLQAIREGAYDYLTKPFKTQELTVLAERARQRARLIADNSDLKRSLRETYRDMELLKTVSAGNNPDLTAGWLERIEKLKTMNVLLDYEAEALKKRLEKGPAARQEGKQ